MRKLLMVVASLLGLLVTIGVFVKPPSKNSVTPRRDRACGPVGLSGPELARWSKLTAKQKGDELFKRNVADDGLTKDAVVSLGRQTLEFAEVTGTDVEQNTVLNRKLFTLWGVTLSQESDAMDQMYTAAQLANKMPMQQLQRTMLFNAPSLQLMGYNFTDSLALIASLTAKGHDAGNVIAIMGRAILTFARQGKPSKQALAELIQKMTEAKSDTEAAEIAVQTLGSKQH